MMFYPTIYGSLWQIPLAQNSGAVVPDEGLESLTPDDRQSLLFCPEQRNAKRIPIAGCLPQKHCRERPKNNLNAVP
jgi:hypothetical protein